MNIPNIPILNKRAPKVKISLKLVQVCDVKFWRALSIISGWSPSYQGA